MHSRILGRRLGTLSAAALAVASMLGNTLAAQAEETSPAPAPQLAPDAPKSYTVRQGDTLWDIASMFLRDPWLWPEIWYVNPQVENPHLIYPGDVLTLAYGPDGRPQITLERGGAVRLSPRVRSEPLAAAIHSIPYDVIASFMSRPMVLDKSQIKDGPHVVSTREQRLVAATGSTIYAANLEGEAGSRYSIVQVGEPLRDPDDRDIVGYRGIFTAEARMTRPGEPATLLITDSRRETHDGDLLFPSEMDAKADFVPRAPEQPVDGRIMLLVDATAMVGQYQAVVINRGARHGLQPGHVLAVWEAGPVVPDRGRGTVSNVSKVARTFAPKVKLPDERTGLVMVFKTFDRISYALVMQAELPIRELDRVTNP